MYSSRLSNVRSTHVAALKAFCLFLAASSQVVALDGTVEINQACAVNVGCTAGDAPGFPVTITEPGSYVLTGNLFVPDSTGIKIEADHVTLDLNGFAISGGESSRMGINFEDRENLEIRNGTVKGFAGEAGLGGEGGDGNRILDLRVLRNEGKGIFLDHGNDLVMGCTVKENGSDGIQVASYSAVINNVVSDNGGNGITAGDDCLIVENTIDGNAGAGILTGGDSRIAKNTVSRSGGDGITSASGISVPVVGIPGNVLASGNTVVGNELGGMNFGLGSMVINNVVQGNDQSDSDAWGVSVTGMSMVRGNNVGLNGFDQTISNGIFAGVSPNADVSISYRGNMIEGNLVEGLTGLEFEAVDLPGGNFWAENRFYCGSVVNEDQAIDGGGNLFNCTP